jgi:2-haloacid dehalogenase
MLVAGESSTIEVLAFDVYGTLLDPIGISRRLATVLPDAAGPVAVEWRRTQLEYTFRLAAMGRYEDFAAVTAKALAQALAVTGQTLTATEQAALLAAYDHLPPYPDARDGLARLRAAGYPLAVFSNGTPAMLAAALTNARLRPLLDPVVSVDEVRSYKPAPRVYEHLARRLGRPAASVLLVSANPFDVIGARAAGLQAAWLNRAGGPFDTLAEPPPLVAASLSELAGLLLPG